MRDGGAQPLSARGTAVGAGHIGGSPGFIDEDKPCRLEIRLGFEPIPTARQDVGAVLLGGVRGLFLRVIRCRLKKRRSVP
jgi:hypothetical protein